MQSQTISGSVIKDVAKTDLPSFSNESIGGGDFNEQATRDIDSEVLVMPADNTENVWLRAIAEALQGCVVNSVKFIKGNVAASDREEFAPNESFKLRANVTFPDTPDHDPNDPDSLPSQPYSLRFDIERTDAPAPESG